MKKNLLKNLSLFTFFAACLLPASAQYLHQGYYGFEMVDHDQNPATPEKHGCWMDDNGGKESSTYLTISTDNPASGAQCLKMGGDLDIAAALDWKIEIGTDNNIGSRPAGITVDGGEATKAYMMSIKVYIPSENGTSPISSFKTVYEEDGWNQINWDLSGVSERDQWVTLVQGVNLKPSSASSKMILIVHAANVVGAGNKHIFIDDLSIVDVPDLDNDDATMNETYYSFEGGAWYIQFPQYATISADNAASGLTSLKISCSDYANVGTDEFKANSQGASGGTINLTAGKYYELSMKVMLKDEVGAVYPSGIHTNTIGSAYQTISWDLSDITTKGQWVEKKQTIQFFGGQAEGTAVTAEMGIKVDGGQMPDVGFGTIYIDDISMVETVSNSMEDKSSFECTVYPNPATEYIMIKGVQGAVVQLYNVAGVLVKEFLAENENENISVLDLPAGLYLVKTSRNNQVSINKIKIK